METKTIAIGKIIKRYRLVNDIRQEDMAEKMGVSRATLINYEKGYTAINIDALDRLKNYYPDFNLEEEKTKPSIIEDNKIDFKILAGVLSKNKKYIFLTTFIFAFCGTSSSFLFKKYYNAQITLYPAKKEIGQGLAQFQSLAANLGMNTAKNDQSFHIPDVVKSRLIANRAIFQKWITKDGRSVNLIELWNLKKKNHC